MSSASFVRWLCRPRRIPVILLSAGALALAAPVAVPVFGARTPDTRHLQRQVAQGKALSAQGMTVTLPIRANMVGARWQGTSDELQMRARGADGTWSQWVPLHAGSEDGPDPGSDEARRMPQGHVVTTPVWVGDAEQVQVRSAGGGSVRDLRLSYVNSAGTATATSAAITELTTTAAEALDPVASAVPRQPSIITRARWGANEGLRRADPAYADELKALVIHHTVTANTYSRSEAPQIVRGIYSYHVNTNGWNDIGYNFLIDRFGRIYEGRYGGIRQNVIGAHAGGFNTSTTGVALIGTHSEVAPNTAQRAALKALISWRLDLGHVRATASTVLTSAGNDRYPTGTRVTKPTVMGHRDVYSTECPGADAYEIIPGLRRPAWLEGGVKFASPRVSTSYGYDGRLTGLRVTATGNRPQQYTVTVYRHSTGQVIRRFRGFGTNADLRWNGRNGDGGPAWRWDTRVRLTSLADGAYSTPWEIVLPSSGPPPPVDISARKLAPAGTPPILQSNGDGVADRLTFDYTLNTPARVRLELYRNRSFVRRIFAPTNTRAGTHRYSFSGIIDGTPLVPGTGYSLRLIARDPLGRGDRFTIPFTFDDTLAFPAMLNNGRFSPNGDGKRDRLAFQVATMAPAPLRVEVRNLGGGTVYRVLHDATVSGTIRLRWDGTNRRGVALPAGTYRIHATVTTAQGTITITRQTTIVS